MFLLNVPPNSLGLVSDEDVHVLKEFTELRTSIFSRNLAKNALVTSSSTRRGITDSQYSPQNVLTEGIYSYWAPEENQSNWTLYVEFQDPVTFNVLQVLEPTHMGQRAIAFHLDWWNGKGQWEEVTCGMTVGYKRLLRFPTVVYSRLRFIIDKCRADPLISYLGIHMDTVSSLDISYPSSVSYFNGSRVPQQAASSNHTQFVSV